MKLLSRVEWRKKRLTPLAEKMLVDIFNSERRLRTAVKVNTLDRERLAARDLDNQAFLLREVSVEKELDGDNDEELIAKFKAMAVETLEDNEDIPIANVLVKEMAELPAEDYAWLNVTRVRNGRDHALRLGMKEPFALLLPEELWEQTPAKDRKTIESVLGSTTRTFSHKTAKTIADRMNDAILIASVGEPAVGLHVAVDWMPFLDVVTPKAVHLAFRARLAPAQVRSGPTALRIRWR